MKAFWLLSQTDGLLKSSEFEGIKTLPEGKFATPRYPLRHHQNVDAIIQDVDGIALDESVLYSEVAISLTSSGRVIRCIRAKIVVENVNPGE